MKTKYLISFLALAFMCITFTACMDETFPKSGTATSDQVAESDEGVRGMANSLTNYFLATNVYGSSYNFEIGYYGYSLVREAMCNDMHVANSSYDYFGDGARTTYIGPNYSLAVVTWTYYFRFLKRANDMIGIIDPDNSTEAMIEYLGVAHSMRAFLYMDLVRMHEFKKTGVDKLDNEAQANNVYGLAVPIITPDIKENEARNNPRQQYYVIYELIFNDLDRAEELLKDYKRTAKNIANLSVVYGLKARMWLELATRFTKYPSDLNTVTSNTNIKISTKEECYNKAIEYAQKAITASGATPLSKSEWYGGSSYSDGFNNISTNAWMWGTIMVPENLWQDWRSFTGNMSSEQQYGVGGPRYKSYRVIDKRLFERIPDADWRKVTWVAPEDVGKGAGDKYHTVLSDTEFNKLVAYTSLKFKPRNGNTTVGTEGAVTDYPLMRVEEMYFIEAEALAGAKGVQAGVTALESFMNTYRYDTDIATYKCNATSLEEFQKELMIQKRIEFWGEGVVFWDYKRLEMQIVRGYTGTNSHAGYRFNSLEGYCAPWLNICLSRYEVQHNPATIQNPDPSLAIKEWSE